MTRDENSTRADIYETIERRIDALEDMVRDLERRHAWWIENIRQQMSEAGAALARPMPANTKEKHHD